MNPKTLSMFKDNKQSHAIVWNYIFKCMKVKFPKFAKSTRQCYKKYENLKGKYFEIKHAQMNGEQRPYWLYFNEMDYIISHFPGHRPRINIDSNNSVAATPTTATPTANTNTMMSIENSNSNTNTSTNSDFTEQPTKSLRIASMAASNIDASGDNAQSTHLPKKLQLLNLIRSAKPTKFTEKSDGWELVLKKAQNKGLYSLNKTWLDFYYEVWITHIDDTITKWESFISGQRIVRYDEGDKIMFDIIKDEWNDYGTNSTQSIRVPTLRTLPGYIEKLKDLRSDNIIADDFDLLLDQSDHESPAFLSNSTSKTGHLENGHTFPVHRHTSPPPNIPNVFDRHSALTQYKQQALQLKNQFIKTKMSAYVDKHNRKCYKMDLELYKIEKELGLPPSEFTQKIAQTQIVNAHTTTASMNMAPIPSMHQHPQQTQSQQPQPQQILTNSLTNTGPQQIQAVNGATANANAQSVHGHMNEAAFFAKVDIKREMNFDDGGNFDFV